MIGLCEPPAGAVEHRLRNATLPMQPSRAAGELILSDGLREKTPHRHPTATPEVREVGLAPLGTRCRQRSRTCKVDMPVRGWLSTFLCMFLLAACASGKAPTNGFTRAFHPVRRASTSPPITERTPVRAVNRCNPMAGCVFGFSCVRRCGGAVEIRSCCACPELLIDVQRCRPLDMLDGSRVFDDERDDGYRAPTPED